MCVFPLTLNQEYCPKAIAVHLKPITMDDVHLDHRPMTRNPPVDSDTKAN
jgi:hypothetical protein